MTIHFIIGCPGSGKSTFRHSRFSSLPFTDVWDFQGNCATTKDIYRSYVRHRRKAINMAKEGQDFVVEHTLMRAVRRAYYINRLKEHKLICWHTSNGGLYGQDALAVFEPPTVEEGFAEVHEIPRLELTPQEEWTSGPTGLGECHVPKDATKGMRNK